MRAILVLMLSCLASYAAEFRGKWSSAHSGGSGEIRLNLEQDSEVVFTFEGSEVKAKVARSSVEGNAVELEFHFTIDGNDLKSVFKGTRDTGKVTGKYVTTVRGEGTPVDGGSIEVSAAN